MGRYARNSIGQYAPVGAAADDLPGGATPTGKKTIDTTAEVDVASYATAQVVDENLTAENIKKDVEVLGILGEFEGGGGGLASEVFQTIARVTLNVTGAGDAPLAYVLSSSLWDCVAIYFDGEGWGTLEPTAEFTVSNGQLTMALFGIIDAGFEIANPTDWEITVTSGDAVVETEESSKFVTITGDCVISVKHL